MMETGPQNAHRPFVVKYPGGEALLWARSVREAIETTRRVMGLSAETALCCVELCSGYSTSESAPVAGGP